MPPSKLWLKRGWSGKFWSKIRCWAAPTTPTNGPCSGPATVWITRRKYMTSWPSFSEWITSSTLPSWLGKIASTSTLWRWGRSLGRKSSTICRKVTFCQTKWLLLGKLTHKLITHWSEVCAEVPWLPEMTIIATLETTQIMFGSWNLPNLREEEVFSFCKIWVSFQRKNLTW